MKYSFSLLVLLLVLQAAGQFRHDNVLFKTVDPSDLCKTLKENKDYLLLDVRSPGEHDDTSRFAGYNLGHLDGAMNIDIRQLGSRIHELDAYRDKPLFVYCSHSQRSRRALKMLADSGFTNLHNINGGMTAIYYSSLNGKDCFNTLVKTGNAYDIISFNTLAGKLKSGKPPVILDVRSDSSFRHISNNPKENAIGTIRGAVNIPLASLEQRMNEVPADREIIITDLYGDDAPAAAVLLIKNERKNISVLVEGIERVLMTDPKDLVSPQLYQSPVAYGTMSAAEFGRNASSNQAFTVLDIRPGEEFSNKHKENWRNIGHIRNAVHIPVSELKARLQEIDMKKPVILYGTGSGPEVFDAAEFLHIKGYKVTVLMGGIFNLRWTAGNSRGQAYLKDLVADIPEDNR